MFILFYFYYYFFFLSLSNSVLMCHFENLPMQYREIFSDVKIKKYFGKEKLIFLIYLFGEAVLTSTHHLSFRLNREK